MAWPLWLGAEQVFSSLTSANAAAWVQAIGSVAAIGVAIAVGRHSAQENRMAALEMRRLNTRSRMDIAYGLAYRAWALCGDVLALIDRRGGTVTVDDLDAVSDALAQMPLADLGDDTFAERVMRCRSLTLKVRSVLTNYLDTPSDQRGSIRTRAVEDLKSHALALHCARMDMDFERRQTLQRMEWMEGIFGPVDEVDV